ncbi:MAG: TM0106 family RecB-like putative nuclease [Candidatus Melainabacteria bacterium]|nr:TM0106 family RecB-like putative nuclease [Candidatus Melainabacteria bacterium]
MKLSVSDLLNFYRCPRLLFLNQYGDKTLQLAPSDFLKKLWKAGRTYESRVIDFFKYEKPKYKIGDYEKGHEETLKLMKAGVETIYQGVLKSDELTGIPDFLIKAKGNSLLGDYYYYAVDIKGATTSRERYIFQLGCYSYLLGDIQGFTPLYGGLLLLDVDLQIKYFYGLMKQVIYAINESKNILRDPDAMPDLFIDSNCQMCQWYSFCLPEATEKEHLSLISGVNRKIKEKLEKIPIKNYGELAGCNQDDISSIEELAGEKGTNVLIQSKALKERKIYLKSRTDLPKSNREIFIDFESDMIFDEKGTELVRVDYLIGLLKNENGRDNYSYLLLEDEEKLFNDFVLFLNNHSECNFYHYGHYEQSIFDSKWDKLPKVNLINLEKVVKDSIIMPVTSYSLKNIAKVLGFRWKNKEASAIQSMCWYSNYLETKDKAYLDLSIQYNKDDCLALLFVKNWLLALREKDVPVGEFIDLNELASICKF